ncbi:MAG: hypothetical protein HYV02_07745 [Deltaproteobacteria bacterium]|nr:hypothetical protein [Deltaproteobacteria bacterium]
MKTTFIIFNTLVKRGTLQAYALGGATALLFYAEPATTYDRERIGILLEGKVPFDQDLLLDILSRYDLTERWEKMHG